MAKITAGTFLKPLGVKYLKSEFTRNDGLHAVYDLDGEEIHAAYDKFFDEMFIYTSKRKIQWFNNVSKRVEKVKEEVKKYLGNGI